MKLKNYEFIQTEDGSYSAYSKLFNEACHSTHGAKSETIKHYIEGCKIESSKALHSPLNILEVGLGVGIGLIETINVTKDHPMHFVTMEIDEDLVTFVIENFEQLKETKKVIDTTDYKLYELKKENLTLSILVGNARFTLNEFLKSNPIKFHAIYQDAFSPKKNATLWTKEWFETLYQCAHTDCIMSTYSSSSSIRKAMIAANWSVFAGDKFGKKRSSTRAMIQGETDPDIILHLNRSPAILLTDDNADSYTIKDTHEKK